MGRMAKDHARKTGPRYPTNVVTKADQSVERLIVSAIKRKYPNHRRVGEELGQSGPNARYAWVIDPIDGTLNFAAGIPIFGTMIAFTDYDEVVMGAIYLPPTKELFFARQGKGAYRNGKAIRTFSPDSIKGTRGYVSSTMSDPATSFYEDLCKLVRGNFVHLSAFGSLAFGACLVARGACDWYVAASPQFTDIAPVSIILSEAGYKVTDVHGERVRLGSSGIVAARPRPHAQLLQLTKRTLGRAAN